MKRYKTLALITLSLIISNSWACTTGNCQESIPAVFHKDSTQNVFRYIGIPLETGKSDCETFILDLSPKKKLDISNVYELKFYLESTANQTIKLSFFSGTGWSNEISIVTERIEGYNIVPIAVYANTNGIDISTVSKIKLVFESSVESRIDEIEFVYEEVIIEEPKGVESKRLKEVKEENKQMKKEEYESNENRKRKNLELR